MKTPEKCEQIARVISEGGTSKEAAESIGVPPSTVREWERTDAEFSSLLTRARADWADVKAEEMLRAQEAEPRMIVAEDGTERVDSGWVQHITSRANYTKWLISKRDPKRYGDAAAQTTVNVGVVVARESIDELRARLASRKPVIPLCGTGAEQALILDSQE